MADAGPLRRLGAEPLGIRLWLADLDAWPAAGGPPLSEAEVERASRFAFERDRQRYLAAHRALREVLARAGSPACGEAFALGPHGKPYLPAPAACSFSLSHSGGWALIGVADAGEIGVDLELWHPIHDLVALARANFSAPEVAELAGHAGDAATTAFLQGWTRKEACLKAVGSGLTIAPNLFTAGLVPDQRRLTLPSESGRVTLDLASLAPGAGMLAAVARVADAVRRT
jgi:4'-phosphopantetheinyl transferase